ncbi:hypothetical protein R3P38DRAFT_3373666 [Favolaschia claudopus]|uniref:Uncharacterized protein n=1 Tax=Favolaschia claudopus TaxID=2862362 RepID=A0AAV9ZS59_9AGAR
MSPTTTTPQHDDSAAQSYRPRTSTPPHDRSADQTAPDFDSFTVFDDTPLDDYDGPVADSLINTEVEVLETVIKVPTLRPLAKIGGNAQILSRRNEALAKGASGLAKVV